MIQTTASIEKIFPFKNELKSSLLLPVQKKPLFAYATNRKQYCGAHIDHITVKNCSYIFVKCCRVLFILRWEHYTINNQFRGGVQHEEEITLVF